MRDQPFSTEHRDLIIETTINREVKVYDGPVQGGYSTNLFAINKFVKNTYLLAKLRATMKKKLRVLISLKHKETTLSGKCLHELTIVSMIQQLERYLNPFDEQPVRNFKTKEVIEDNFIKGLLSSSILVENLLLEFINKRLLPPEKRFDFFSPIKNPNKHQKLSMYSKHLIC